nr:hypothetical protein [Tanacetum cinerariifolium]
MMDWLSLVETDKVIHNVETDIVKLVVEIESFGMSSDDFDKKTVSFDELQLKQADLSCVHALIKLHLHEIYVVPTPERIAFSAKVVIEKFGLKSPFRKLIHNHGNLHKRVNKIRNELDEAQKAIDRDPSSSILREEHAHYLLAFKEAQLDEERFLKQKAKIEWFKAGKRGLRQGDPLSPYLFTLVMEILTLILQCRVRASDEFQYHHLCKQQMIINLCFADDLFLFSHGNPCSVAVIIDVLEEFKQVSGLVPSIPKSTAFFCNVRNAIKASILNYMPFAEGVLLVSIDSIPARFIDVTTFISLISKGKMAVSILSRLMLAATSYYIWLERNGRLFKKKTSSPDQIVDVIISMLRLKLVTF